MKKAIALLLCLLMTMGVIVPAAAGALIPSDRAQDDLPAVYVKLKRGETMKLWAWGFADTTRTYSWTDMLEETPVKGIRCKGAKGTVTATVTKGGDWLSAKVRGKKVFLTVTGENLKSKNLTAVVKIADDEGTFGKIRITRGGMTRFASVQQKGARIELRINRCKGITTIATIRRVVWNTLGQEVQALGSLRVAQIQPGTGKVTIADNQLELRAGYTYGYTVSYISPAFNRSLRTSAACIRLTSRYGNAVGAVATVGNSTLYYDDQWLYELGQN